MTVASRQHKGVPHPVEQPGGTPPLRSRPAWALLAQHYQKLKDVHLRQLFADDQAAASGSPSKQPDFISTTPRTASPKKR